MKTSLYGSLICGLCAAIAILVTPLSAQTTGQQSQPMASSQVPHPAGAATSGSQGWTPTQQSSAWQQPFNPSQPYGSSYQYQSGYGSYPSGWYQAGYGSYPMYGDCCCQDYGNTGGYGYSYGSPGYQTAYPGFNQGYAQPAFPQAGFSQTPFRVGEQIQTGSNGAQLMIGSQVLGSVPQNQSLTVHEIQGPWVGTSAQVNGRQESGWIHMSELAPSYMASRPEQPSTQPSQEQR